MMMRMMMRMMMMMRGRMRMMVMSQILRISVLVRLFVWELKQQPLKKWFLAL